MIAQSHRQPPRTDAAGHAGAISDEQIAEIAARFEQGKRIRRTLPPNGRLHIDRALPFLAVYRRPPRRSRTLNRPGGDPGTAGLVKGQAAYLVAPSSGKSKKEMTGLVNRMVTLGCDTFEAFLLLELWAGPQPESPPDNRHGFPAPMFTIVASRQHFSTATVEAIEQALKRIRILGKTSTVAVEFREKPWPAQFPSLVSAALARQVNCYRLGIEIAPIYRDPETGEVRPIVLRRLHQGVTNAIKHGVFAFSYAHTTQRPDSHHALGRRAVVKAVWSVDRRLAEIGQSFGFLLQITPVNIDQAWNAFKRSRFEREPRFYYRPLPVDPALLKRDLYAIPLERIEDPTLANLFREKRTELEWELSMLRDRGTPNFRYGSLQHFGAVSDNLCTQAADLLHRLAPRSTDKAGAGAVRADEFCRRAQAEIAYYRQQYPDMAAQVEVRDDVTGLIVSNGNLLIGRQARFSVKRVDALLHHEVGTHVLTWYAGQAQPFQLLAGGLAGYEEFQEGIALVAEYLAGGFTAHRLRVLAGRVVGVYAMLDGATFIDAFRLLHRQYGFDQRAAYAITARIYRSGGLTKDAVYLRGLLDILRYFREDGELDILFVGKLARRHVPVLRELRDRQILRPVPLRPRYLEQDAAQQRLEALRNGLSILDLLPTRR